MGQEIATTNSNPLSISILTEQRTVLAGQLAAASEDAIVSALIKMHRAGLAYPPQIDAKAAGKVYGFAMKGIAIEGLKRAIERFVRGEVAGQNPNFIPTPPAFAAEARRCAAELYADMARINETIATIEEGRLVKPKRTPEELERVRRMVATVKETAEILGEAERPRPIPYEYWRNKENPDPAAEPEGKSIEERMAEINREDGRV